MIFYNTNNAFSPVDNEMFTFPSFGPIYGMRRPQQSCFGFQQPRRSEQSSYSNPYGFQASGSKPGVKSKREEDKKPKNFKTQVTINGFKPEEVEVKVNLQNKIVTINAIKTSDSVKSRHFIRSIALPMDCDAERVGIIFIGNGSLEITAPRMPKKNQNQPTNIERIQVGKEVILVEDIPTDKSAEKEVQGGFMDDDSEIILTESDQVLEKMEEEEDKVEEEIIEEELTVPVQIRSTPKEKQNEEKPPQTDFEFVINVQDFRPEDISLTLDQATGILSIQAIRMELQYDGSVSKKELSKEVVISGKDYNLRKLSSKLGNDGTLKIVAPRKKVIQNQSKSIPINVM